MNVSRIFAVCLSVIGVLACGHKTTTPVTPGSITPELDQSNTPTWDGAWSVIGRGLTVPRFAQTVTASKARLTAVEIDLMTGNPGRGGDEITVTIIVGDRVLATASRSVPEGSDGMMRFEFPNPGVLVPPGLTFQLVVEDTSKEVFGWRYGLDTYAGGVAFFNGAPWNNGAFDFRFRTFGY